MLRFWVNTLLLCSGIAGYGQGRRNLKMKKRKTRGLGIRAKILFPASLVIVLLCVVMGCNSY